MAEPEREALRETFESAADGYDTARPRYPEALFDALVAITGMGRGAAVLEIGCGTGIATEPLARRGYRVTGVELGRALGEVARARLAGYPAVAIVHASFDTWVPREWGAFDLVVAATAWHWLDPATKYGRAHRHLRSGGSLAFWSATHVVPDDGDPFFAEIQDVYDEIGEGLPDGWAPFRPGAIPDLIDEITATGLFELVGVEQFDWEIIYDAGGYLALLDTFSGHIAMEEWQRDRLYGEIRRRLALRPSGTVRRHWGAALHVARRVG